jgi:predicted ATPase
MLSEVTIRQFRCLKVVSVPLQPLTVLIGANDTGKSSFLAALDLLLKGSRGSGFSKLDRWRDSGYPHVQGRWAGSPISREFPNKWVGGEVGNPLSLLLPSAGPGMVSQGRPGVPALHPAGGGVPSLVDYFLRRDRERFFSFVETLKERIPGLEDVEVETPDPSQRRLDLVIDGGLRIPADQASAGVRLLMFFVALAHHPSPPKVILLEEPENGLHPRRLGYIVKLLRDLSQGAFGSLEVPHASQVILTTHSPYLLDEIDPTTEQVLVFSRQADGSRTAAPVDTERLKTFLDDFKLGEVWFNQEEEGLLPRPDPSPRDERQAG